MQDYGTLATDEEIEKTVKALKENGMQAIVADDKEQAREAVLAIIPEGAEVFTLTSMSTAEAGLREILDESGKYDSIRKKLANFDPKDQKSAMRRLGAAPDWAISSVHAVTQGGHLYIASNTGSQLASQAYGAEHVVFVVGTHKIVADDNEAMQRLNEYVFPLENERALEAYGSGSYISKLLCIRREISPGRITVVFVKEKIGF